MTVKFKFHLKSGKTFECISKMSEDRLKQIITSCKCIYGIEGVLTFEDCCVRLSECAVVEWEVLESE